MPKKLTTAEWVEKAKSIHGELYDYSAVEYVNSKTPVKVLCRTHGPWDCQPSNHVAHGRGCPECGGSLKKSTSSFVDDAVRVHGQIYDYSSTDYRNSHTKVTIRCYEHGDFQQTPTAHISGQGCPVCGNRDRLDRNRCPGPRKTHKYMFLLIFEWCPGPDLNRHDLNGRGILSPLCLPISPPGQR